jgi:serine/threonine protein kinase
MKTNLPAKEHPLFNEIAEIARTDFSRILLVRELRTKKLAILKVASQDTRMQGNHLSASEKAANNESIVNEVRVWQSIRNNRVHPALPKLLAVKEDGSFLAVAKSTQSNYLAEPYYSGLTLADLINNRGYFKKRFVYIIRHINLGLLHFFCRFTTPKSLNLLRWLGIPDRLVVPTRHITSGKPLPVYQAISFIHQMASGLHHLHTNANAYVHLDLKPINVMLKLLQRPGHESAKEVVIIDLGESRPQGTRATMGTPWWRPPEQVNIKASGNGKLNDSYAHSSMDIYSLGQIFGFLLTGTHPEELETKKYTDLTSRFVYPTGTSKKRKDELNNAIVALLAQCLATKPTLRPSAQTVCSELSKIEKSLPRPKIWQRWLVLVVLPLVAILFACLSLGKGFVCGNLPQQAIKNIGERGANFISTLCHTPNQVTRIPPTQSAVPTATKLAIGTPTTRTAPTPIDTPTLTAKPTPEPLITPTITPLTAKPTPGSLVTPTITPLTAKPTPGSLVKPTITPTRASITPTLTPFDTSIPIPILIFNPTPIITILNSETSGESNVQNCDDPGSWDLVGKTKIAFRAENILPGDIYDLQLILPNGDTKTMDSSRSEDGSSNPNFRKSQDGAYNIYEGAFTADHLKAWGIPAKPNSGTYKWRIVIKRSGREISESGACEFEFTGN